MGKNIDRTFGLIDRSTGDAAPHVDKAYTLTTRFPGEPMQLWPFVLPMPAAIAATLNSADWDEVLTQFQAPRPPHNLSAFETLILLLRVSGHKPDALKHAVNKMVARCLYHKFVQHKIRAGDSAWLAPRSMTDTKGEPL